MSQRHAFERWLDHDARLFVEFTTHERDVVSYSIILTVFDEDEIHTVRVYDAAHAINEMHRHTRTGGKQSGEPFHGGTLGEGLRTAMADCVDGYRRMIEGWDR